MHKGIDMASDRPTRQEPAGTLRRIPFQPHQLVDRITPAADLFVLAHLGIPRIARDEWSLDVCGLVERPRRLDFTDLARYPKRTLEAFHQCAGDPTAPERAERRIANVVWGGVALSDILDDAGVAPEAAYIWSFGADHGAFAGEAVPFYWKDLPLARLPGGDVLVAYECDGEALSPEHGFPARLVVPGYYGTNSVKWLYRIELAKTRATGLFTTRYYNDPPRTPASSPSPVWSAGPEAVIVHPEPGSVVPAGDLSVTGYAWADAGVAMVDLSADDGQTWIAAEVEPRRQRSWQPFRGALAIGTGREIAVRAFDRDGVGQPASAARNAIHRVPLAVSGIRRVR